MSILASRLSIDRLTGTLLVGYAIIVVITTLSDANNYLPRFVPSGISGLLSIFLGVLIWDYLSTGGARLVRVYRATLPVLIPFWLITLLALVWAYLPDSYWGDRGTFIYLPLYNLLALLMGTALAAVPGLTKRHRMVFLFSLLVLLTTVMSELFFGTDFSKTFGRAAGFSENPNAAATLLIALAICSVDWKNPDLLNGIIWLGAGIGILATLSRSGLVLYIFMIAIYVIFTATARLKAFLTFSFLVTLVAVTLYLAWAQVVSLFESIEVFSQYAAQQRIRNLGYILQGELVNVSADTRLNLIREYARLISESPIFGYGTGFSFGQQLGPHNIYLNQWVNNGVLGLLLLLGFLILSFHHFLRYGDIRGMAFVGAFCIGGIFSHNLLDSLPLLTMFGFLGALACIGNSSTSVVHQSARKRRTKIPVGSRA